MSSSSFSLYILALLSLFLFVSTRPDDAEAKEQANKFIRGLNLSRGYDANIVKDDTLGNASKIVEKRFRFPSLSDYETTDADGPNVQDFGHYAGYFKLNNTEGARMFYFFFESRKNKANTPVVLWLTGGPGCSSSLALFRENGPCQLTNNLSLVWNQYGWDKEANLIYVDQPTGTGFSYSTNESDIRTTSEEISADLYEFLQAFFDKHSEYQNNDFYITGESYAGHYIPALATEIHRKNKNKQGNHINMKGMAIGNGLTNPLIQIKSLRFYALLMKLINESQFNDLSKPVSTCEEEVQKACDGTNSSACAKANADCSIILDAILSYNVDLNYYDVRKKRNGSLPYDFSDVRRFLNQASVKEALGVGLNITFFQCSRTVFRALLGDLMRNFAVGIHELLEDGIKLLVYAGEYDLICNWLGNVEWVNEIKWSGQKDFMSARSILFEVDGEKAGMQKSNGPLTFLKMNGAGHMVSMDQPKSSLEMLKRWMNDIPL